MKQFFKLTLTILIAALTSKTTNAQRAPLNVCFSDVFGYTWNFTNITMTSATTYYAEGTVSAYSNSKATLWVDLTNGASNASVEVHAINLSADGCATGFTDSFVYVGTSSIVHGSGYSGSGTWTSYCSGGVINSGTWDASGPCGSGAKLKLNISGVTPAGSAGKSGTVSPIVLPAVVCFTDVFGYTWKFTSISSTSATSYYAEGTVSAYANSKATLWVDVSNGSGNASVEVHAINLSADGCATGFTDSFVYVGTSSIIHGSGYTGSGTWTSYCSGGVINSGTWDAAGPCGSAVKLATNTSGITPAGSGKKSSSISSARAPLAVCFTDVFGYKWNFTSITMTSATTYYAEGTVSAYANSKATLWVDVTNGASNACAEVHAINLSADGCATGFTDSFVYVGSANIIHGSGYSGSGTWTSYCSGGVINSGTWDASGPCGSTLQKTKTGGTVPAKSGTDLKKNESSLIAVPNPLKNNTQLKYTVASAGRVNMTVYNYMHQPVKVLVNENKSAGSYNVTWNAINSNGSRVSPGLYQVVMIVGDKMHSSTLQVL